MTCHDRRVTPFPLGHTFQRTCRACVVTVLLFPAPTAANGDVRQNDDRAFIRQLRSMMSALRAESVADAAKIRTAYEDTARVGFRDREALRNALAAGTLTPLPFQPHRFNVQPRLNGYSPVGEKDLAYQDLYLAADAAALGCLLHVAARVSTPVDVTSLVRHLAYQRALQRTNPNARTELPMHVLGLAFDISVLNRPLRAAIEIRDVLRRMREDGDLYFVAETRQLVFHVVPTRERLPFYREVGNTLISLPSSAVWNASNSLQPTSPAQVELRDARFDRRMVFAGSMLNVAYDSPREILLLAMLSASWATMRRQRSRRSRALHEVAD
jgi:hypothetical protein